MEAPQNCMERRLNMRGIVQRLPTILFFTVALVGLVWMWISLMTKPAWIKMLTYNVNFGDFWLHVRTITDRGLSHVYEGGHDMIFPPLAYLYYSVIARICTLANGGMPVTDYVSFTTGYFLLAFRCFIIGGLLFSGINAYCRQLGKRRSVCLNAILLCSFPFFIVVESGNAVLGVLILLIYALRMRNEESSVEKELALILIAIAANFKLYPAVLGLLYIKEKRYRETLRLLVYGLLLFVIPFVFTGGIDGFRLFFTNLRATALDNVCFSLSNIYGFALLYSSWLGPNAALIGKILTLLYAVLVLVVLFTKKMDWQTILLFTSLIMIVPMHANAYTGVYILIPLLHFLQECDSPSMNPQKIVINSIYAVMQGLVLFGYFSNSISIFYYPYHALYAFLGLILLVKLLERRPKAMVMTVLNP